MLPFAIVYAALFFWFVYQKESMWAATALIITWVCLAAHSVIKETRRAARSNE